MRCEKRKKIADDDSGLLENKNGRRNFQVFFLYLLHTTKFDFPPSYRIFRFVWYHAIIIIIGSVRVVVWSHAQIRLISNEYTTIIRVSHIMVRPLSGRFHECVMRNAWIIFKLHSAINLLTAIDAVHGNRRDSRTNFRHDFLFLGIFLSSFFCTMDDRCNKIAFVVSANNDSLAIIRHNLKCVYISRRTGDLR